MNQNSFRPKINNDIIKSPLKEDNKNLNDSRIINNSFSMENKSRNDDLETDNIHGNLKKFHVELKANSQRKEKKTKIKTKFNYKMAQLYNILIRKDKKNNSTKKITPNEIKINISYK